MKIGCLRRLNGYMQVYLKSEWKTIHHTEFCNLNKVVSGVNYCVDRNSVRVMCPKCNIGGGHSINSYQPKCHICKDEMMQPAGNTEIKCSWQEFQKYIKLLTEVQSEYHS